MSPILPVPHYTFATTTTTADSHMDPIGFSIGVVGLAGLVTTCIQFIQLIRSNDAFDRDTQILFRKLDIERELLMQWAHGCGLLEPHHVDGTLFGPRTDAVVYGVLEEISILLAEAANLQRKYSRTPARDANKEAKIGLRRKIMFAIDEKNEINHVINELSLFVAKLRELVPSVAERRAVREDLKAIGCDARTLRLRLYNPERDSHSYRDDHRTNLKIDAATNKADRRHDGRREEHYTSRAHLDLPQLLPSYSQSQLSYSGSHSTYATPSSHTTHKSSRSTSSARSRQSSADAAREMWGDLTGKNGRCCSSYSRRRA